MKLYFLFLINQFQSNLAYRANTILHSCGSLLYLLVQVSIWKILLKTGYFASGTQEIKLENMVTYVVISNCMSVFINGEVFRMIQSKIQSGEIATDLIKPLNFKIYIFFTYMGKSFFRVIFELIPLLVISFIFWNIKPPTNLLLFIISLTNAVIIHFLIMYIFGLLAFWFIEAWTFRSIIDEAIYLLSGALVPLWFFPKVIYQISLGLPFRFIYFIPISIYLGKVDNLDLPGIFLQQLLWIGILLLVEGIMWNFGTKKLVIQGG